MVSGLSQEPRACGQSPLVVLVHVVDPQVETGGDLPQAGGALIARRAANHDHRVADLHRGVLEGAARAGGPRALAEAECASQPLERGRAVLVVEVGAECRVAESLVIAHAVLLVLSPGAPCGFLACRRYQGSSSAQPCLAFRSASSGRSRSSPRARE